MYIGKHDISNHLCIVVFPNYVSITEHFWSHLFILFISFFYTIYKVFEISIWIITTVFIENAKNNYILIIHDVINIDIMLRLKAFFFFFRFC